MQDIDTRQISDFDKVLNDLLDEFPKMRRELHEELGELAKKEVDSAIPDSFTDENPGGGDKIRRWQKIYIGSGGGYAAVRPVGSKDGGGVGKNSAGAITNYLEGGHKTRGSKAQKPKKSSLKVAYVNGYHFYQTARSSVEAKAIKAAEQFANKLAGQLEGGR